MALQPGRGAGEFWGHSLENPSRAIRIPCFVKLPGSAALREVRVTGDVDAVAESGRAVGQPGGRVAGRLPERAHSHKFTAGSGDQLELPVPSDGPVRTQYAPEADLGKKSETPNAVKP